MSLTDEDKNWIVEQLRVTSEELRHEFKVDLERIETTLLTEFHKWASPMDMRQRTHTAAIRALDAEMEYLQDKVKKLEGGTSPTT